MLLTPTEDVLAWLAILYPIKRRLELLLHFQKPFARIQIEAYQFVKVPATFRHVLNRRATVTGVLGR